MTYHQHHLQLTVRTVSDKWSDTYRANLLLVYIWTNKTYHVGVTVIIPFRYDSIKVHVWDASDDYLLHDMIDEFDRLHVTKWVCTVVRCIS